MSKEEPGHEGMGLESEQDLESSKRSIMDSARAVAENPDTPEKMKRWAEQILEEGESLEE